jgi:hypothetical protein
MRPSWTIVRDGPSVLSSKTSRRRAIPAKLRDTIGGTRDATTLEESAEDREQGSQAIMGHLHRRRRRVPFMSSGPSPVVFAAALSACSSVASSGTAGDAAVSDDFDGSLGSSGTPVGTYFPGDGHLHRRGGTGESWQDANDSAYATFVYLSITNIQIYADGDLVINDSSSPGIAEQLAIPQFLNFCMQTQPGNGTDYPPNTDAEGNNDPFVEYFRVWAPT